MIHRVVLIVIASSFAQAAAAQVVQLPTIHRFGYSGSIRVPDGGTMSLGGSANSGTAWTSRNRNSGGRGMSRSAANAGASVTVIDHASIDRDLRGRIHRRDIDRRSEIEEGKALVRYARKMRSAGNDSLARRAYELSFGKLDANLRRLARQEHERFYGPASTIARSSR